MIYDGVTIHIDDTAVSDYWHKKNIADEAGDLVIGNAGLSVSDVHTNGPLFIDVARDNSW